MENIGKVYRILGKSLLVVFWLKPGLSGLILGYFRGKFWENVPFSREIVFGRVWAEIRPTGLSGSIFEYFLEKFTVF